MCYCECVCVGRFAEKQANEARGGSRNMRSEVRNCPCLVTVTTKRSIASKEQNQLLKFCTKSCDCFKHCTSMVGLFYSSTSVLRLQTPKDQQTNTKSGNNPNWLWRKRQLILILLHSLSFLTPLSAFNSSFHPSLTLQTVSRTTIQALIV